VTKESSPGRTGSLEERQRGEFEKDRGEIPSSKRNQMPLRVLLQLYREDLRGIVDKGGEVSGGRRELSGMKGVGG